MIKKEDRKEKPMPWSVEELQDVTNAYLTMAKLESEKKKVVRKDFYSQLSEIFGRRETIYPLRIQNIAQCLKEVEGAPQLNGIKGIGNIGGKTREVIITEYFHFNKQEVPAEIAETFPSNKPAKAKASPKTDAEKEYNSKLRKLVATAELIHYGPINEVSNELKDVKSTISDLNNQLKETEDEAKLVELNETRSKMIKSQDQLSAKITEFKLSVATEYNKTLEGLIKQTNLVKPTVETEAN